MYTKCKKLSLLTIPAIGLVLSSVAPSAMAACGSEDYLGQVCATAASYCPKDTAEAAGQLLAISQYQALYAVVGNVYGGDGRTTFGLPDLRGRSPVGQGQAPGLTRVTTGQRMGVEKVTLAVNNMPTHNHVATTEMGALSFSGQMQASSGAPNQASPDGHALPTMATRGATQIYTDAAVNTAMAAGSVTGTVTGNGTTTVANTGGSRSFIGRGPGLGIRYCVVTNGLFPPRN